MNTDESLSAVDKCALRLTSSLRLTFRSGAVSQPKHFLTSSLAQWAQYTWVPKIHSGTVCTKIARLTKYQQDGGWASVATGSSSVVLLA